MSPQPAWVRVASVVALAAACHGAMLTAAPSLAWAQPAGQKGSLIQRGSDLFDDQQYEESIQTLSAALLRPGTSKADKIEIYRLLAYNYITLKRTEEADAAVRGLLVLDETFKLPATESPRFRDFFDATRKKWEGEGKPGKVAEGKSADAEKPVTITHTSPPQTDPDTTIKLSGDIDDPGGRVRGVAVYYRTGQEGKFVTVNANYAMGSFHTQVPASSVKPPFVEYYIQAIDKSGLPITSRGDAAAPLRVVVPAPAKGGSVFGSPWFWIPVGLVVVGGAIAVGVLATRSSSTDNGKTTSTVTVGVRE
jgi:hypothetical protein